MKKKIIFFVMSFLFLLGTGSLYAQELGKKYRIKNTALGQYLTIFNNDAHPTGTIGGVGISSYVESSSQIFTFENAGNGNVYIRSVDGYYIVCRQWNVDACNSTDKSPITLYYLDATYFYLRDAGLTDKSATNNYFKVQEINSKVYVFCDYDLSTYLKNSCKFQLEEVVEVIPGTPANLVATDVSYDGLVLQWNTSENAQTYKVYQDGNLFATGITGTSYTVTGLNPETTYNFTVTAVSTTSESAHSNQVTVTTQAEPAKCRVIFELTDSYGDGWNGNKITVNYNNGKSDVLTFSSGYSETYYIDVFQGTEMTLNITTSSYSGECSLVVKYENGTVIYSFGVYEMSSASITRTIDCADVSEIAPPANLTATAVDHQSITLSWEAGDEYVQSYKALRDDILLASFTETSYTFGGLQPETTYNLEIVAVRGPIEASAQIQVTTTEAPPSCNIILELQDTGNDGWNGNNLYVIQGGNGQQFTLDSGGSATYNMEITQGSKIDLEFAQSGLKPEECTFVVRYENGIVIWEKTTGTYNYGGYLNSYLIDCLDVTPAAPTDLTETASDHRSISLSWNPGDGNARGYNVYQNDELVAENISETSYTAQELLSETEYCFTVTAVRNANESEFSDEICVETAAMPDEPQVVPIGEGTTAYTGYMPICTNNAFSYTQQVYTKDEIDFGTGEISKIAFKQSNSVITTRNVEVFLVNVEEGTTLNGWQAVTESDKYFSGSINTLGTGKNLEITLDNNFLYTGGDLLLCVNDKTMDFTALPARFYVYTTSNRAIYTRRDGQAAINPYNMNGVGYTTSNNNYIELSIKAVERGVEVTPEVIALGDVRMGNYWTEKGLASTQVSVKATQTTVTNITCDNDFFTLSAIDYNTNPIVFDLSYDNTRQVLGEQTANVVVTYGDGDTEVIPVTATAYNPAQGDVYENPIEITFTDDSYTNSPTGLHDDYILPGEETDGNAQEAVYYFELTEDVLVNADVEGTNGLVAIYSAEDLATSGPSSNNNYTGEEVELIPTTPTTFFYDFNDGSLNDFTLINEDNNAANWFTDNTGVDATTCIKSSSNGIAVNNVIMTKAVYNITKDSELHLYVACHADGSSNTTYQDKIKVQVSKDGVNFTGITEIKASSSSFSEYVVDFGTLFAQFDLEYGNYHIALRHEDSYRRDVRIDNLELTDGVVLDDDASGSLNRINAVKYPAGEYYLVAAAEGDFTLNVTISELTAPVAATCIAPENNAMEQDDPILRWSFGDYTESYRVLLGTSETLTDDDVVVEWTTSLSERFETSGLQPSTKYYWRIDAGNIAGITSSEVYSFVTPLAAPYGVYTSTQRVYPGNDAYVHWSRYDTLGIVKYHVYLDDVRVTDEPVLGPSYTLSGLAENVNPGYKVNITAVYENMGESPMSSDINIQVAGQVALEVQVYDNNYSPVEGASVTLVSGIDQFGYNIQDSTFTTDASGYASVNILKLANNASYTVNINKERYYDYEVNINAGDIANVGTYRIDCVLGLAGPTNVVATPDAVYYGEATTITWDAVADVIGYNIYVNNIYRHNGQPVEETQYVISDLPYNEDMSENVIEVKAIFNNGYESSAEPVSVLVGGRFAVNINVIDNMDNPIEGATVVITNNEFLDQLGNEVPEYTLTTDENGYATQVLPLLPNLSGSDYNYYEVRVSKGLYNEGLYMITTYNSDYTNGDVSELNFVLELPTPNSVMAAENSYFIGDDVVLTWEAPELNTRELRGYNVYRVTGDYYEDNIEYEQLNDETVTDLTYTISGLEYGSHSFGVSAVYDEGESRVVSTNITVSGYGKLIGNVVDMKGDPVSGADIEVRGYDETNAERIYTDIVTGRDGRFSIENIPVSGWEGYTVYATKFDYYDYASSHADSTNAYVVYGEISEVTVVMQSNPIVEMNVEAEDRGDSAYISWDTPYGSQGYNLYRLDMQSNDVTELADSLDVNNYSDHDWKDLENGEYQYGVSVFMQENVSVTESFENGLPEGWTTYYTGDVNATQTARNWKIVSQVNLYEGYYTPFDGDYFAAADNAANASTTRKYYMVTSLIDLTECTEPQITFAYNTPYYSAYYANAEGFTNELNVLILTEQQGQESAGNGEGTEVWTNNAVATDWWNNVTIDLSDYEGQKIYVAFENIANQGRGTGVDRFEFTANKSPYVSGINWTTPLVKGAIVYTGEGNWKDGANWSSGNVPLATDDVTIRGKVTVSGEVEINSITIARGEGMMGYGEGEEYSLTLESDAILRVEGTITNNSYSGAFIINDGAQVFQNAVDVDATFVMNIENPTTWGEHPKEGWQVVASPLKGSSTYSFRPDEGDYDLYKYDGSQELQWVNYKYHTQSGDMFEYKFENGEMPTGFLSIDNDGDEYKWGTTIYNNINQSFTLNNGVLGSVSSLCSEAMEGADNYLILPKSKILKGSYLTFRAVCYFSDDFTKGQWGYNSESYEILISEDGTDLADFVSIGETHVTAGGTLYESMTNAWTTYTIDLSDYADKEVYVAIRHRNTGDTRWNMLFVDDVELVSGDVGIFDNEFVQGRGYLVSYETQTKAEFMGQLNHEKTFTFKEVASYDENNPYANFYLLGNPFAFNMNWSNIQSINVYPAYATVNSGGTYSYSVAGNEAPIKVGDGFFVKTTGSNPSFKYTEGMRRFDNKYVNIIAKGANGEDNIVVNFSGTEGEGFNKLENFNDEIAEVYLLGKDGRYAILNYNEDVETVDVKFDAKRLGRYTISAITEGEFETVILVDRTTGIETNLLVEDYTFTSTADEAKDRFILKFVNSQQPPTADGQFAYQNGEELIVNAQGMIQIVDVLGRVVYQNEHSNDINRINVKNFDNATYVIRCLNGNEIKTQKIVIL